MGLHAFYVSKELHSKPQRNHFNNLIDRRYSR